MKRFTARRWNVLEKTKIPGNKKAEDIFEH